MSQTSLVYTNEKHAKSQPRPLVFRLDITGAKTSQFVPVGADALLAYDALSQAAIDAALGSSSEFLAAALDATALGANDAALLVPMRGQCGKVSGASVKLYAEDGSLTQELNCKAVATLTASTPVNECAAGSAGNIVVKFKDITGLDAATDGYLVIEIHWVAK